METSTGFFDLRGSGKTFEYLKNSGQVGRWCGKDLVSVVVKDELIFEVLGPRWRWTPPSNSGVAALGIFEIMLGSLDDLLVGPTIGAKGIAVKTLRPLLVVLAGEGLGVQRDDRDLAPAVRAAAVGREGEDSDMVFNLRG